MVFHFQTNNDRLDNAIIGRVQEFVNSGVPIKKKKKKKTYTINNVRRDNRKKILYAKLSYDLAPLEKSFAKYIIHHYLSDFIMLRSPWCSAFL